MKLSRVLLVVGAGVLVYKALRSVKIVKVDFPGELPQEFILASEVIGEVYGKEFEKKFEKEMKNAESKTYTNLTDKVVELAKERPITIHDANYEVAREVQESTDKAKQLIQEYHENYKEVTV
ncbi:hypothetical protein PNO24_00675 [Gemella haemolysans]|uniref:hypothetical protein n=1 Tax=Gemella haemolysans TaxID=1379 RepID=UPI00232EC2DA|nr:hypothetical protein [Gemella haemolysans]MDB6212441.1 hypothetical protein [Gemella haemolysans]